MKCANCHRSLQATHQFCPQCGTPTTLPPKAKDLDDDDDAENDIDDRDDDDCDDDDGVELATIAQDRHDFLIKVLLHVGGAIGAFTILEMCLMQSRGILRFANNLANGWGVVLLAFIGVSWLADHWARSQSSRELQYAGLGLYVVAEAILFVPLLLVAQAYAPGAIPQAAIMTIGLVSAIGWFVYQSKKRFDWMGNLLKAAGVLTGAIVIGAIIFGINLGFFFSIAMIALAGGSLVYQLDAVLHDYDDDQYVAAALGLFSSIMLLFWYLLRILISLARNDD